MVDDVDWIPEDLPYTGSEAAAVKIPRQANNSCGSVRSVNQSRLCARILTENEGDDNDLYVYCAGLIGVSRKVGNVQTQGGIVAHNSVQICEVHSG